MVAFLPRLLETRSRWKLPTFAGSALKRADNRLAAIAALIAAFAWVVLVASASAMVIAEVWKLHARTAHRLAMELPEPPGPGRTLRSVPYVLLKP